MLDADLPTVGRLLQTHRTGEVARKGDPPACAFVGDGVERGVGHEVVDLDELRACVVAAAHRSASVGCVVHGDGSRAQRRRAVDDGTGQDAARASKGALGDLSAPIVVGGDATHVPDAGDAVAEVEGEVGRVELMDVHVPQAWDQELACGIEHGGVGRHSNLVGRSHRGDAVVANDDGPVGVRVG